jgi:hypothetical protein
MNSFAVQYLAFLFAKSCHGGIASCTYHDSHDLGIEIGYERSYAKGGEPNQHGKDLARLRTVFTSSVEPNGMGIPCGTCLRLPPNTSWFMDIS